MVLTNVEILRVIVHEVIRSAHVAGRPPVLSEVLVSLNGQGKDLVGRRLIATVSSGSHCVDVTVEDVTEGSPFDHISRMFDGDDASFVTSSKHLAQSLSTAQTSGAIKSGSAIFVQGTCIVDTTASRFLAIIKADPDQALFKSITDESVSLTFVGDMLLGESQRLIKIALFIEDNPPASGPSGSSSPIRRTEDFTIRVFDHLMQNSGSGNAAAYFYSTFLKCTLAHSASRVTRQFHDATVEFIEGLDLDSAEKFELRGDLISYLRGNQAVLEPREFATDVLPAAKQDAFLRFCTERGLTTAFTKDLTLLKGKLRRQSLKFTSNVTLYGKPEVMKDSVKIIGPTPEGWTKLEIKGAIEALP